jgi:hypothetical protein
VRVNGSWQPIGNRSTDLPCVKFLNIVSVPDFYAYTSEPNRMTSGNDFEIGKAVADKLKGIEKERQQRILRWVAESLGLDFGVAPAAERRAGETAGITALATTQQANAHLLQRQHERVDIKSFVDSKKPKSDVQFAAVVGYYYRFEAPAETRTDSIDAEVLRDAARLAGRRRPPKPLATLNNAKTLGYLDSSERGKFRINSVGENLVAMTLPGGQPENARERTKRGKSKRKKR